MVIALILKVVFNIRHFTILILSTREYMGSFEFLVSSSIYSFSVLNPSLYRSFTYLVRLTPRYFIYYFLFCHTMHLNYSFPSLYSPVFPPSSPFSWNITPLLAPFREEPASQGYQANMTQQVTIRIEKKPHIRAGQGNPRGGKGLQEYGRVKDNTPMPV